MASFRVATFNVENLFARFKFASNIQPDDAVRDGWNANQTAFSIQGETSKRLTAKAITDTEADVIALQEVENLDTLRRFRSEYLSRADWPYALAVDGNDPRLIDVAVLSRVPILHVRSYADMRSGRQPVFSRDCLEVDVEAPDGTPVTLYVNHLKSMLDKKDGANGRRNTRAKRVAQSRAVRAIVESRFTTPAKGRFIVLGDLNDYEAADQGTTCGITDLIGWDAVENVVDRLPVNERWTHYYKVSGAPGDGHHQIDYVLPSRALADRLAGPPTLIRNGQPKKATRYSGPYYRGLGVDGAKASDHCPVVVELDL